MLGSSIQAKVLEEEAIKSWAPFSEGSEYIIWIKSVQAQNKINTTLLCFGPSICPLNHVGILACQQRDLCLILLKPWDISVRSEYITHTALFNTFIYIQEEKLPIGRFLLDLAEGLEHSSLLS